MSLYFVLGTGRPASFAMCVRRSIVRSVGSTATDGEEPSSGASAAGSSIRRSDGKIVNRKRFCETGSGIGEPRRSCLLTDESAAHCRLGFRRRHRAVLCNRLGISKSTWHTDKYIVVARMSVQLTRDKLRIAGVSGRPLVLGQQLAVLCDHTEVEPLRIVPLERPNLRRIPIVSKRIFGEDNPNGSANGQLAWVPSSFVMRPSLAISWSLLVPPFSSSPASNAFPPTLTESSAGKTLSGLISDQFAIRLLVRSRWRSLVRRGVCAVAVGVQSPESWLLDKTTRARLLHQNGLLNQPL